MPTKNIGTKLTLGALAMVIPGAATTAQAAWVRGRGTVQGHAIVDPLYYAPPGQTLVPTISTGMFNDAQTGFTSQADLGNGKLRGDAYVVNGSGQAFANPVMSETVSFYNDSSSDSSWDFSFDVDGHVTTSGQSFPVEQTFPGYGTFRTTAIQFAVHIFPANTVGPIGSPNSWQDQLDSALFSQTLDVAGFPSTGMVDSGMDVLLADTISGSVPLAQGANSFDIVLVLNLLANVPSGYDSSIHMDFLNTAAFAIDSPIEFQSSSGVFLTGTNVIPEPTGLALLAFAGLALRKRVRRA